MNMNKCSITWNSAVLFFPAHWGVKAFVVYLKGASLFLWIHFLNISSKCESWELFERQVTSWCCSTLWEDINEQWLFLPNEAKVICCQRGNRLQTSYQQGLAVAKRRGGEGGARELSFNCVKLAGYLRASVHRHDASAFTRSPTRLRS